jgi:uncharacterized protein (DUF885 family)
MQARSFSAVCSALVAVFALAACQRQEPAGDAAQPGSSAAAAVNALADELLAYLRETSASVRMRSGVPVVSFDPVTLEQAQKEAEFGARMLERLNAIALDGLPSEERLLAGLLRHTFEMSADAVESYWFEFAVTPYAGGMDLNEAHSILANQPLGTASDRESFLRLLDSYAVMLDQIAAKTRAQAERGLRVPKPAIPGVIETFRGLRATASALAPSAERLKRVPSEEAASFNAQVQERLTKRVVPAYEAIIGLFDDAHVRNAPEQVGLGNYPGGKEHYLRLIRHYTGLDLDPQDIHEMGKRQVAALEERMQAIRAQLGFKGSREEFHDRLRKDRRFIAKSPEEVEQRYRAYIAKVQPHLPQYFSRLPKARYDVARVAPAAEKGMTYGYYQPPTPADPVGYYFYNGSDLEKRSMVSAAHLIYHELVPGHHLHVALQTEREGTHPVRQFLFYGAFTEGWAEYAASLGEEMGLYADPYDLYGHLLLQAMLSVRLVVDTGMNALGTSLEEARAYMKAHTFESDVQIDSETLRYSTDIYAQALSYRLGYEKFWELRRRAEEALGAAFDMREFHAAAIGEGAMPLNVLEEHIDRFVAERTQ